MRKIKTLTQLLFPLFIGFIIGGIAQDNEALLSIGIALLILDVIIGIALQTRLDNPTYTRTRRSYLEEKNSPKTEEDLRERMDAVFERLNRQAWGVHNIKEHEAGRFLLDVCKQMPYAPAPNTLSNVHIIFPEHINKKPAIVYAFKLQPDAICQIAYIFLVHPSDGPLRFFTVETSYFVPCVLCEYSNGGRLNYGRVEVKNVPTRIAEILNDDDENA